MRSLFLSLLFVPALAFAQDEAPEGPAIAVGEAVFVTEDVRSKRFVDTDLSGPSFEANESVKVLYLDGERARVRRGSRYGWVDASLLTADNPAAGAPIDIDIEALLREAGIEQP